MTALLLVTQVSPLDAKSSTLAGLSTTLSATGAINQVPLEVVLETAALSELVLREQPIEIDTTVTLGDSKLSVQGTIDKPQDFRALQIDVELDLPALDNLARAGNVSLPIIPPLKLSGAL